MPYLLFFSLLFNFNLFAKDHSFKDFTEANYFAPIDNNFLQLKAVCRQNFDEKDRKKYFEILFYSKNKHVFDLNKHFRAYEVGHRNLKKPFYTFTIRNWFHTFAIETKNEKFISNTSQLTKRRNEVIPEKLFNDILAHGKFTLFFHYLMDNTKSNGEFTVVNPAALSSCFK